MKLQKYQITLMHWLFRSTITIELGETKKEAESTLKSLRKRYNKMFWIKKTPIFC